MWNTSNTSLNTRSFVLKSQKPFPSFLEGSSYWKPTVFFLQIFFGSTNLCHEILHEDHCIIIRFPGICNMHWIKTKKIAISTTNTKLERRQPNGKVSRALNITVIGLAGFPVPRSLATNSPPTKPLQSGVKTGNTKLSINDWDRREVTLKEFASHLRRVTPFTEDSSQFCLKILSWPFTPWHQYACSLYICWGADKENLFSQSRAPLVGDYYCVIQEGYCEEKLDASRSKGLKGYFLLRSCWME